MKLSCFFNCTFITCGFMHLKELNIYFDYGAVVAAGSARNY